MNNEEKIFNQISELEIKLFEQEHRPLIIIKNFINRNNYEKGDPRRKAIYISFVWRLFFSPTVIAVSGGFIALISLLMLGYQTVILIDQNTLMGYQNDLIIDQNTKITQQNYLVEAQRRSSLQFEISEILNRIDSELTKEKVTKRISEHLKSRIIAVTTVMKPYRSFHNDSLSKPYSYEKGHLFSALLNSEIHEDDLADIFEKGNFSNMWLENITFGKGTVNSKQKVNLRKILIEDSFIDKVNFKNITFNEIELINCNIKNLKTNIAISEMMILENTTIIDSNIILDKNEDTQSGGIPITLALNNSKIISSTISRQKNAFENNNYLYIFSRGKSNQIVESIIKKVSLNIQIDDNSKLFLENVFYGPIDHLLAVRYNEEKIYGDLYTKNKIDLQTSTKINKVPTLIYSQPDWLLKLSVRKENIIFFRLLNKQKDLSLHKYSFD